MLGIIDWGIGGISIYKGVKERRPETPVIYLSDTGATPYGKMGRRELAGRLDRVIEVLRGKGVTHLVIGCNAASTAIPDLADHGILIEGVIDTAVETAARERPGRLGLIGGRRTVVSGVYRNAFARRGISVEQRIAQPLSGMIEAGDVSSDELGSAAARILKPIRNCTHILLACTHYPAIAGELKRHVSDATRFIDPAGAMAEKAAAWKLRGSGADEFYTTGDASAMKRSARLAFGVKPDKVRKIRI